MPVSLRASLLPIGLCLVAMASIQVGAGLAKQMFAVIGAEGAVALRVSFAAGILIAVQRPWRARLTRRQAGTVLSYGVALGVMNLLYYLALRTIPLGITVALEFTGPLALALFASHRKLDLLWVALAAGGLLLLAVPAAHVAPALDGRGVIYALGAGFCWAIYILCGKRASDIPPGQATALGMIVAAAIVTPVGATREGWALFAPALFPLAIAVAILSSALPYTLEMIAMARLPRRTFGILMSLEPAIAMLAGWVLLGEHLTAGQDAAIACVISASLGSVLTMGDPRPAAEV